MNTEVLQIAVKAVQIYAESHPRPSHVTQKQAAEMLDITAPTFKKMLLNGQIKLNRCGKVPIEQIDQVIAARG